MIFYLYFRITAWIATVLEKQKSGFRVDGRAYFLKGGDTGLSAIVPGDPSASYLIEVIKSDDPDIGMPPKGGKLFDDEVELLEQWIAEGAFWPGQMEDKVEEGTDHWAFQEIKRPKVSTITSNPIDSFIEQRLIKEGIPKGEEADPLTLIRRASIVLTGLPLNHPEWLNFCGIIQNIQRRPIPN